MAETNDVFGILVARHGSGWKAAHVSVNAWVRPPGFENNEGVVCLTADAISGDELDSHIDELIEQLQMLKTKGRRVIAAIQREEDKCRGR